MRLVHAMAPSLWLVMGDFNALFGAHEKSGRSSSASSRQDFLSTVNDYIHHCLNMRGSFVTWTNSRGRLDPRDHVEAWLDRALYFEYWLSY